ncbi:MAG: methyl-accepting chemotaxis protein [Kangiellaceae bacterium]|jgi:methyl-accepting chemotaxis protein
MNLTVTARIAGGAGLVIILLGLLVFSGLSGVSNINEGLGEVTEKSTPMLIEQGEIVQSLLQAAAQVNFYHQTDDAGKLEVIGSQYQAQIDKNKAARDRLSFLAEGFPQISAPLVQSSETLQQYLELVPKSFDSHKKDLELRDLISGKRGDFEDVADELGSMLSDLADEISNNQTKSTLRSMSSMIEEATITITDALAFKRSEQVQTAVNDISSLWEDFSKKFQTVQADSSATSNEYYEQSQEAIQNFAELINGNENILKLLEQQLLSKEAANNQLVESGQVSTEVLNRLRKVSNAVKDRTASIKEEAKDNVSSSRMFIITFALVAIIVAIGINWWVLQSIRSPLTEMLRVMAKVSDGDLRENVEVKSQDEIGKLSEGFNQLINQLSSMLNEISASSQQLSAAAEETSAISSESHANINKQKEQTDMIATAMTEMTATVDEVASSATNTSKEVSNADREAIEGQKIVQNNIETINGLAQEIQKAAEVIDKLDTYSTNIGTVLDVIRGIADQTNLLALNAAIEAARAGEQGRGFAVVADEVRTLASKTQESTSEIQEMIERLQSGTLEAVKVMKTSTHEAQNSVAETAKAGESLSKITDAVSVINDMSSHIASAADEQSAVSREMHENVLSISQAADQTAQGASENLAASQEMATLAENLQRLVGRFQF